MPITCACARTPTVRAVTEAMRSSGVITVMMIWLGIMTPPVPIREMHMDGRAVRISFRSARTRHAAAG